MIKLRHQQPSLWHRGLAEDIEGLWEPWMRLVDELLEDEQLLDTVYEAQGERYPQSRRRGRCSVPRLSRSIEANRQRLQTAEHQAVRSPPDRPLLVEPGH